MRLFANKRAIELSINFLVTFILAIVIFGMGMFLLRGFMTGAEDSLGITEDELNRRIASLSCDATRNTICLLNDKQTASVNDIHAFGVTVNNYLNQGSEFRITFDGWTTPEGGSSLTIFPPDATFEIGAKSQIPRSFGINIPRGTTPGEYSFRVRVESTDPNSDFRATTTRFFFKVQ